MIYRPPKIAQLKIQCDIQVKQVTGKDDHGQEIFSWVTMESEYAYVEPLAGRDLEFARQLYHLATYRVTMRYNKNLTPTARVVYDGKVLYCGSVQNMDELNVWSVALCSEGQP